MPVSKTAHCKFAEISLTKTTTTTKKWFSHEPIPNDGPGYRSDYSK